MKLPVPAPSAAPPPGLRVGTAGWSYADWDGLVYPSPAPPTFDHLAWMARFMDVVEINATFYRPARPRDAAGWVERTAFHPGFRFCAKLDRAFTHSREGGTAATEAAFRAGIRPLLEADRLLAVVIQFPYAFRNTSTGRRKLATLLNRFADLPLVVEVRHQSWMAADILAFLAARGVTLAGVDQPAVGESLGPSLPLTGSFFYVRLHGRNAADWFRKDAGRDERYNYLYAAEELQPWVDRLGAASAAGHNGVIIANNHFRGQAAANAVEIRAALAGGPVAAPAELLAAYPRLAASARPLPPPAGTSGRLF